jgi:hypothetical protein
MRYRKRPNQSGKKTPQGTYFELFFSKIPGSKSFILARALVKTMFKHLRYRYTLAHNSPTACATTQEGQNQRTVETHLSPPKIGISRISCVRSPSKSRKRRVLSYSNTSAIDTRLRTTLRQRPRPRKLFEEQKEFPSLKAVSA